MWYCHPVLAALGTSKIKYERFQSPTFSFSSCKTDQFNLQFQFSPTSHACSVFSITTNHMPASPSMAPLQGQLMVTTGWPPALLHSWCFLSATQKWSSCLSLVSLFSHMLSPSCTIASDFISASKNRPLSLYSKALWLASGPCSQICLSWILAVISTDLST